MKMRVVICLTVLILIAAIPSTVQADGIIIPLPPVCEPEPCLPDLLSMSQFEIRYHHVNVTIDNQIATTYIDQVFYNPNDWTIQGSYVFPVPKGAAVTDFRLWIDGEPVQGETLESLQARQRYEEIVREMKDPALLEYADQGALQASLYPIPPKGERRIELEYTEMIPAENGLVRYIYPLNTEKFSTRPLEEVQIGIKISDSSPIRTAYSPTHEVEMVRDGAHRLSVSYEEVDVKPDINFAFYYSIGVEEAFHLLTYRDPGDGVQASGYFTILLAPRLHREADPLPKDVLLVLDRSGSMDGEKFVQAANALHYILTHLNPEDRFNLISFSNDMEIFASEIQTIAAVDEALSWIRRQSTAGSTDINRALLEAAGMSSRERPTYVIFLTDGLPTEGVVDAEKILTNLEKAAGDNFRLFVFGVGYDVDTFLLDLLAENHHGTSTYVLPGQAIDEILSGFYATISTPVLTNLTLDFGEIKVLDLYPDPLPDLFEGSQIIIVGEYREGGLTDVTLRGEINQEKQTIVFSDQFFTTVEATRENDWAHLHFISRLWATRKIGHLLKQVRLNGPEPELIDQIVGLSIRYGIVTPYTSYLVIEPMPFGSAAQGQIAREQLAELEAGQDAPVYGREAVEKAVGHDALANTNLASLPQAEHSDLLRVVGSRTLILSDGGIWIDTAYDPEKTETVKVSFLSDEYFSLVELFPDLAGSFALGPRVIAISEGVAYEVVGEDETVQKMAFPTPDEPEENKDASQVDDLINEQLLSNDEKSEESPQSSQPDSGPVNSAESLEPGNLLPCLGGLLPLMLPGLVWLVRRKGN